MIRGKPRSALCLSRFRGLAPARALSQPRLPPDRPRGCILLSQRGPPAWLSRAASQLRLSARPPPIAALAPWHLLSALTSLRASQARPAPPPCSRPSPRPLTLVRLPPWLARRSSSGATEARRRSRDKRELRTRRHAKRSMWREMKLPALVCSAMWACCDDTSSDDDDHNTSSAVLLLCADVFSRTTPSPTKNW